MRETDATLEQIVSAKPAAAELFVRHGLDFCCRGQRTLDAACAEAGVDPAAVRAELARIEDRSDADVDWREQPIDAVIDHVLGRYHAALRRDVPALVELARRVEQAHDDKPSCPRGLVEHLEAIAEAVESHLAKEEQILFPLIRAGRGATAHMPMKVMMLEHEDHGENLRRTRALTNDLVAPQEACASWRELYRGLARLEADLMEHIHLENYVLFPRAAEGAGHA